MNHDSLSIALTLEEFYQDCLANGFAQRTVQCYRSDLNLWQKYLAEHGISSLREITRESIMDYRYYLQGVHRSPKGKPIALTTMSNKIAALKCYMNFCLRSGKILLNPAEQLRLPKKPKALPRGILTKQEIKKLLRVPDIQTLTGFRDRVILELFYATAIRRQELVELKIPDCQLAEKRLLIHGKGNKERWVPIGKKVAEILDIYLCQTRPAMVKNKTHESLIVGKLGNPLCAARVHTIVSGYLKQLGIKSHCHGLRHTVASHLLKGKANIRVIQEILGHNCLSSTQIYTHVDISDMSKAIEKAHPRTTMQVDEI